MNHLKVIIIGAGIGGLTAGLTLRRAGYTIEIYEKTSEIRPAGAGISIWSNGVKVLNSLGLGDEIAKIGGQMDIMEYRSHTDELLNQIHLNSLVQTVGQRPYPVSRTELQSLLLNAFNTDIETVKLNAQCIRIEQDEHRVTAYFADGYQTSGDVLIAADGAHSQLRDYVVGHPVKLRYADYVNWNGLVEINGDLGDKNTWVIYVGEGKRASMMPIGNHQFYYFFGCPMVKGTIVEPESRQQELKQIFAGWPFPVQSLIEHLNPYESNRLEIHDLDPLKTLVRGRVALLGDAAHATTPTLGQGGCQAMEDAEILSRFLLTTNIGVEYALKRYETARKERTSTLVLKARKRADMIYGKHPDLTQKWYEQLKQETETDVINALSQTILGGPFH
ncbi:FAD-dependent urate oxidase [Planktothrix serta PCC 8927]|uniref:FAD-dependent urate hydroxylase n=1 Tax=Planktothrix serta PCC 8927 TaxID=671068 RepID=A0A7Z9C0F4_9CYAN|nr:FAD-dependent urate hydroxylase HpxO [Planktothrix serta]VXD22954.1 FAD-dependent urate oxidase [Planktothrix serta PCC 8927]